MRERVNVELGGRKPEGLERLLELTVAPLIVYFSRAKWARDGSDIRR